MVRKLQLPLGCRRIPHPLSALALLRKLLIALLWYFPLTLQALLRRRPHPLLALALVQRNLLLPLHKRIRVLIALSSHRSMKEGEEGMRQQCLQ
ncbi:MAG: hypothetical protein C5B47_07215 [Verrucomicrobia bacterium]|nr:MAG: hypothetical protein C5B47_07215 [Verrucomicrobiota bacterium]